MIPQHFKKKKARNYPNICRYLIARHYGYDISDVYVVWFCYTLGNFKALLSTTKKDSRYFEVTFDELRRKMYIDEYRKATQKILRRPE